MIKAALLLVMTGIALAVTVALLVGLAWIAVAIPVMICAAVANRVEAAGDRLTSGYRARSSPPSAHPDATRSHAAHTRP
ncbi:MAG TPA: hypothetical protein VKH83_12470 [Methylomirabilota bacterium]|nr:hypothetical protein [Methylomirabilota bacterium]